MHAEECIIRCFIVWTQLTRAFVVDVKKANVLQMGGSGLQIGDETVEYN